MSDWTPEFLKTSFREWAAQPETLNQALIEQADQLGTAVFQSYWSQLHTRITEFFHQPYSYRRGGDVWCDDQDWIQAAEAWLRRQPECLSPMSAVETHLYFGSIEFFDLARDTLDRWLDHGGFDYEGYLDLIALVYPYHERSRHFIESGDWEFQYLTRVFTNLRHPPLDEWLAKFASSDLEDAGWFFSAKTMELLGRDEIEKRISDRVLSTTRDALVEYANRKRTAAEMQDIEGCDLCYESEAVCRIAATMDWTDVGTTLLDNPQFVALMNLGLTTGVDETIGRRLNPDIGSLSSSQLFHHSPTLLALSWFVPEHPQLGLNAARSLVVARCCDQRMIGHELPFAIAWKRFRQSQSRPSASRP